MEVKVIDVMGTDLTVVNANRVSFKKEHIKFDYEKDEKLIKYLATHDHWVLSDIAVCSFIKGTNIRCKTISKTPSGVGVE